MTPAVIAIDGPAASGKSTVARGVAERLGYFHLNSGLLYRAVTWAGIRGGWVGEEGPEFRRRVEELDLDLRPDPPGFRLLVDGRDPGRGLTSREVTGRVSDVAARAPVREKVVERLREEAARRDLVCEGRDIGTEVFADAALKVYLVASVAERARRRLAERGAASTAEALAEEAERIRARDERDSTRRLSPLRRAADAVVIDTGGTTPGEVVERVVALASARGLEGGREGGEGRGDGRSAGEGG